MATYLWSTLADGTVIAPFDPSADALQFDDVSISAADVSIQPHSGSASTVFSYGGKTVTLAMDPRSATTSNVVFANGSVLLVGDLTIDIVQDDATNHISGGSGNDQLIGMGGGETLTGGDGNDVLFG